MIDELFKPGSYRTSNNGDRWRYVIENMPDGNGRIVAQCERNEDAERIVREHNAVIKLVDLAKEYRQFVANTWLSDPSGVVWWDDEVISAEDAVILRHAEIDAALAQAEGGK